MRSQTARWLDEHWVLAWVVGLAVLFAASAAIVTVGAVAGRSVGSFAFALVVIAAIVYWINRND